MPPCHRPIHCYQGLRADTPTVLGGRGIKGEGGVGGGALGSTTPLSTLLSLLPICNARPFRVTSFSCKDTLNHPDGSLCVSWHFNMPGNGFGLAHPAAVVALAIPSFSTSRDSRLCRVLYRDAVYPTFLLRINMGMNFYYKTLIVGTRKLIFGFVWEWRVLILGFLCEKLSFCLLLRWLRFWLRG